MRIEEGCYQVQSTGGSSSCGGLHIDSLLLSLLLHKLELSGKGFRDSEEVTDDVSHDGNHCHDDHVMIEMMMVVVVMMMMVVVVMMMMVVVVMMVMIIIVVIIIIIEMMILIELMMIAMIIIMEILPSLPFPFPFLS